MTIQVAVEIDVDSLKAGGMRNGDLLDLIKELDESMGDWNFTLDLYEHFARLKAEHEKEQAEDDARRLAKVQP